MGTHRIQGISDEFVPPIVHLEQLDEIVDVDDGDAILMAQKLATDLGLGVGISAGANFLGALWVQDRLIEDQLAQDRNGDDDVGDAVVVTLFPDSNKKYLSTDLLREEPVHDSFLSPEVEVLGFRTLGRVCQMCQPA